MSVTIFDSLTSPDPIYNVSGTTVDTLNAGDASSGTEVEDGGVITQTAQHTVVYVTNTSSYAHPGVQLPSAAKIGDTVEVYTDQTVSATFTVFPPTDEAFGATTDVAVSISTGGFFRKVGASLWGAKT